MATRAIRSVAISPELRVPAQSGRAGRLLQRLQARRADRRLMGDYRRQADVGRATGARV